MNQNKGIIGITNMRVEHNATDATRITVELVAHPEYNPHHLLSEEWDGIFPGSAIVKCSYCGQWEARKTSCKHCGGAV